MSILDRHRHHHLLISPYSPSLPPGLHRRLCKPIKSGLTIYCLCFCESKYLYSFEWFVGSSDQHGHGQPTDTADLDEGGAEGEDGETPAEIGYLLGLVDRLVDEDFDGTFATLYTDKAFTSFRLAKLLAARRIYLLRMLRTSGRPKNFPRGEVDSDGAANYWPYRGFSKKDLAPTWTRP